MEAAESRARATGPVATPEAGRRLAVAALAAAGVLWGVSFLEAPSIGLMVVEMVAPPSGSASSLLAPTALR